jgi:DNA-binding HxlR family transcriptional regulator
MADDRLARVISCAGAAEILDELVAGPRVLGELRRTVPRSVLGPALRLLAAQGAVRRSTAGSWDGRPLPATVFEITPAGRDLATGLSDLDIWVAVYERYLGD